MFVYIYLLFIFYNFIFYFYFNLFLLIFFFSVESNCELFIAPPIYLLLLFILCVAPLSSLSHL